MVIKLILYLLFTIGGITFIKLGSDGLKLNFSLSLFNMQIPGMFLLGIVCYGISFILWLWIISTNDLNYIYPIALGLSYIGIMVVSYFILHESYNIFNIVGIVFVIVGIILIVWK